MYENHCVNIAASPVKLKRDAGGPGVIEDTLVGVISFGSPLCGAPDAPTVFTKLGFYTDWIETIMEQDVPSAYQMTTTLPPNTMHLINLHRGTEATLKVRPLEALSTYSPTPIKEVDHLRIAQDEGFKDFLATMFTDDDIKDYFDKSYADNSASNNDVQAEQVQQSLKARTTKSKPTLTTIPTPWLKNQIDSSDEIKSERSLAIEATTEYKRKVTILENMSNEDKHLEEDIMTLIDNLDIDKIIKPEISENTKLKETDVHSKRQEKESVKVASSASGENHLNISPNQQSVLNFLFLSEENKERKDDENDELNIQTDSYKDLTFRDRPNNTKKHEVLSETSLYELISLAIDEEAKRLHKGKRYTL